MKNNICQYIIPTNYNMMSLQNDNLNIPVESLELHGMDDEKKQYYIDLAKHTVCDELAHDSAKLMNEQLKKVNLDLKFNHYETTLEQSDKELERCKQQIQALQDDLFEQLKDLILLKAEQMAIRDIFDSVEDEPTIPYDYDYDRESDSE